MTWKYGRQTPDNNLIRFVARRFSEPAVMLDIGSGEGANARELVERGHSVVTLDRDSQTSARYHEDIKEFEWDGATNFDLIYDVNTLCHVPHPPFEKIKSWLKPGGIFFSIWPTYYAPRYIAVGKEFTDFIGWGRLNSSLRMFSSVDISEYKAPDFKGLELESWVVEARP